MIYDPRNIQLSPQQQEDIAALAERTGKTWQEVLQAALNRHIHIVMQAEQPETQESVYDVLQRAGLIGCLQGGPPDLSTNPKYMDGFGESDAT